MEIHTYQCSFCRSVAVSGVRTRHGQDTPCLLCGRWMRWMWAEPVTTDEQRALVGRGLVYTPHLTGQVNTKRPCGICHEWREMDTMIRTDRGGRYCSPACAAVAAEQAQRVTARVEALYQQQPWLRPGAKETA